MIAIALPSDARDRSVDRRAWRWTFSVASPSAPPASATFGRFDVCLAGRLTDHEVLARIAGRSATCSAEELIAELFFRKGADAFSCLRGEFAVVIADRLSREVIVARDHVGLQPVFYARHGESISFAPSTHALTRLRGVSNTPNRVALADALCHRYPDPEETFFADVRRLPGGAFMTIRAGRVYVERYWDPLPVTPRRDGDRPCDDVQFSSRQRRAVLRAMEGGPAGIFLSGGLDSVSIALTARNIAQRGRRPVPVALSLGLPHPSCDERDMQRAVAARLGMRQELVEFDRAVGAEPLSDQALALTGRLSSPLLNLWSPPYLALARRGRALGVETIMTGVGGDEWLSASGYALADLLWRGRFARAGEFVREWRRSEQARGLVWNYGVRPLVGRGFARIAPAWWDARRSAKAVVDDPSWVAPDRSLKAAQRARSHAVLRPADPEAGFARADMRSTLQHGLTAWAFEEYTEIGELAGVRFAHPYFDPDVIDFVSHIPSHRLNRGGWLKGLLRAQLAEPFPTLGFPAQRKVLADDFHEISLRDGQAASAIVREGFPALADIGVVDGAAARTFAIDSRTDARVRTRRLNLLNLEAWVRAQASSTAPR
jgi:asparagine synthase (glutamine-hydrolysing)